MLKFTYKMRTTIIIRHYCNKCSAIKKIKPFVRETSTFVQRSVSYKSSKLKIMKIFVI